MFYIGYRVARVQATAAILILKAIQKVALQVPLQQAIVIVWTRTM